MLTSRSFQVLVSVLITLGLHICCCQTTALTLEPGAGGPGAHHTEGCGHGEGSEESLPQAPDVPHECCGAHSTPLAVQVCTIDLPPLAMVEVVWGVVAFVEPAGEGVAGLGVECAAPAAETTLLGRHCALMV